VSGAVRETPGWTGRFPGFDVLDQVSHWDRVTADVILARTDTPTAVKFFTEPEESCARALLNLLTGQDGHDGELAVPVLEMVDSRLAAGETDGWRYADMPEDGQAWRTTLALLDADARQLSGAAFADAPPADQAKLVQAVQDLASGNWHGLPASHVWSLWTRYACTAFYAHPFAWAEIGFPGPAYPRGYKNVGVGKREPFEVGDAHPSEDPVQEDA
jgi:hypothetical protein